MSDRCHSRIVISNVIVTLLLMSGLLAFTRAGTSRDLKNAKGGEMKLAGNKDNQPVKDPPHPSTPSSVDSRLIAADTRFGFKLYSDVMKKNAGQNVLVAPASVAMALAMTYNGADGTTKAAMARVLEFGELSLEEINRANAELKKILENPDPKVQLQIANSLWARQGLAFKPDFIKRNADWYGAQVSELDFNDPGAPGRINDWVSGKTNGKISKIVDSISADSILFLVNALYFKGKWTDEFNKALTRDEPFHLTGGREKTRPMMRRSGDYPYLENKDFQAISLPYGGGRLSMYVFLPSNESSLKMFHQSLTVANWDTWMTRFVHKDGEIVLPRFKVEFASDLIDALTSLGMGVAFDPRAANFRNMIELRENAYISGVKHKTYADVNEEGTEAAAATSVGIAITSARRPSEPFRMVVDRPFFWAIRDNETGAVLFVGSIVDPQ